MGAVLGCIAIDLACCFGTTACKCCFSMLRLSSSTATRLIYAVLFLLNSVVAWVMLTDWAIRKLKESFERVPYYKLDCPEGLCYGPLAAYRITFVSVLFHTLMFVISFGVKSGSDIRGGMHNGYWGPKLLIYIGLTVAAFYMPNETFTQYGSACAVFGALFLLVQLVLLIDFGYRWSEKLLELYEDTDNRQYLTVLSIVTISMILGSVVGIGLLYGYFSTSCPLNQFFISFNLILAVITCVVSIHPRIQENNPTSGLPVASVVCTYCTYLVSSALMNEPEEACNPMADIHHPRTWSIVIGAIFTLMALVYTTSNTAVQHHAFSSGESDYVAMQDMDSPETVEGFDDETDACTYNYAFFHVIFVIASMYVAMLLTNWDSGVGIDDDAVYIGKSWKAGWVKIITSWIAYVMYNWTMVAPVLFPDRNWA